MKKLTKIALAVSLLASAGAMAQTSGTYNPSWYFQPSVNAIDIDGRYLDDTGTGGGLKFGKALNQNWDIQWGYTYSRAREAGRRYQQDTLGIDALYMMSRQSLRPFLLVGIGAERSKLDTPIRELRSSGAYLSGGLGLQFVMNDRWSAQADVRRIMSNNRGNDFNFDRGYNNLFTVGLNYSFDRPTVRAVSAPAPAPAPAPMAAPAPMPTPAPVAAPAPAPRFERVTLSATELFEFDSAKLRGAQPKLDQIAATLKGTSNFGNINVVGHADRLGSEKYNLDLSKRRAEAVKAYLVQQGVDGSKLSVVGKGESEPVVQCSEKNRTALIKCLEPNRRVVVEEITIERRVQ